MSQSRFRSWYEADLDLGQSRYEADLAVVSLITFSTEKNAINLVTKTWNYLMTGHHRNIGVACLNFKSPCMQSVSCEYRNKLTRRGLHFNKKNLKMPKR